MLKRRLLLSRSDYEILYTTTDDAMLSLTSTVAKNNTITSHTYSDGIGVIKFKKKVDTIVTKAFRDITTLKSCILPDSISSIEDNVFRGCTNLQYVYWPKNYTTIPNYTFHQCTSLNELECPVIESIGQNGFYSCKALSHAPNMSSDVVFTGYNQFYLCTSLEEFHIPDSVTIIPENFLRECTNLNKVTGCNNVTTVNNAAFLSCTLLTDINFGSGLESIGQQAFKQCGITSLNIKDGARINGYEPFANSKLKTITAENLTFYNILRSTFAGMGDGTEEMDCVTWDISECTSINTEVFANCNFAKLNISGWDVRGKGSIGNNSIYGLGWFGNNKSAIIDLTGFKHDSVNIGNLFGATTGQIIGIEDLDMSSVTGFAGRVFGDSTHTTLDLSKWNLINATSLYGFFSTCLNLVSVDFGTYGFGKNSTTYYVFMHYQNGTAFKKMYGFIDCSNSENLWWSNAQQAYRWEVHNLCGNQKHNFFSFNNKNWGAPDEDGNDPDGNLQSLIDTFYTYRFNRKSAGYDVAIISPSDEVMTRLIDNLGHEKLQEIVSDGYYFHKYYDAKFTYEDLVACGETVFYESRDAMELALAEHAVVLGVQPKIDFIGCIRNKESGKETEVMTLINHDGTMFKVDKLKYIDGKLTTTSTSPAYVYMPSFLRSCTAVHYEGGMAPTNITNGGRVFISELLASSLGNSNVFDQNSYINIQFSPRSTDVKAIPYTDTITSVTIKLSGDTPDNIQSVLINNTESVGNMTSGVNYWSTLNDVYIKIWDNFTTFYAG